MPCDCQHLLRDEASRLFAEADRLRRDRRTRVNADNTQLRANAYGAAAGFLKKANGGDMSPNILRGPADADHYRVKVGRYGDRWYVDPLPTDDITDATDSRWPSVSSVKNAASKDWSFVALKRVSATFGEDPDCLAGLADDERYERLKMMNKIGLGRAADRGTMVHTYLERALRGQPLTTPFDKQDGVDYLPAVQAFLDRYQPELVAAELVCINRGMHGVGYGGTADAVIRIDGATYLPDWKSRGSDSSHGAYPEEAKQLGAYAMADYIIAEGEHGPKRMLMPAVDGGLIVSIKPDGVRIYPIDLDKARTQWKALHAFWVEKLTEREAIGNPWAPRSAPAAPVLDLAAQITTAADTQALEVLWQANQAVWTEAHTALARDRKASLTSAA